jgi:hypothetical protein
MVFPLCIEFAVAAVFRMVEANHGMWVVASAEKDGQVGLQDILTASPQRGFALRSIFVQRTPIERIANFDSESRCARFDGNRDNHL